MFIEIKFLKDIILLILFLSSLSDIFFIYNEVVLIRA